MINEQGVIVPAAPVDRKIFRHIEQNLQPQLANDAWPVRFVVTKSDDHAFHCEVGTISRSRFGQDRNLNSIFTFSPRTNKREDKFVTVFLVPTGIGAGIGGHSGDATPTAQLLAATSDVLITHPNVLNAADINEMTANTLYVEGSVITQLLMGTVGLAPARANRILAVIGTHEEQVFVESAINMCNAARASAGINVTKALLLKEPFEMVSEYSAAGRAVGTVTGFSDLCSAIDQHVGEFDAIGISSKVSVSRDLHDRYFHDLSVINPYGGVEAMLTHAMSSIYGVPSAHAPMYEDWETWDQSAGIMDPRLAAEGVSVPFFFSVLKGLKRSPRIVPIEQCNGTWADGLTAEDIDCLVIPDACLGLPVMAAVAQDIPIILVRDDANLADNSIKALATAGARVQVAANYLEAAGIICALRGGVSLDQDPVPLV